MAAGDELFDPFDIVQILNRTDGDVESCHNAKLVTWGAGEIKPIPRQYADHFINKSTFQWDPTEQKYPEQRLVLVDGEGKAVTKGATVERITAEYADSFQTVLDDTNLDARYFDPETGEALTKREFRNVGSDGRHFKGRGIGTPIARAQPELRTESTEALKDIPEPTAAAD